MTDARIVIDADASKVVVETRKAEAAERRLGATTRAMSQETERATKATDSWARMQGVGSAAGRRQIATLHELGTAARRSTLALGALAAAGMADVIKTGAAFESQMSRVKAVTSATETQMKSLNTLAMRMGRDTKFSAGEAASAMYELASAGFTVKEMNGALRGTMALAAASNIELADAAEISANALRGFGLASSKSVHVADVLATAVNKSSVEMGDLQLSMKYIGPIARSTGQSFEAMTAALEIMGDAGIKGEQAGTSLRGGLLRLVKPTKQVQQGFDMLHLKTSELAGPKGLRPLSEIISLIDEKTKGMAKSERNTAIARIFGTEALSGMLALIDEGSVKLDRYTRANEHADGASKKAAKTMQDNVSGAFEQLRGSIETVEISLFQQFQKPLKEVLLDATREVNTKGKQVTEFFDHVFDLPEFKRADIGGKLQILLDELDKTGLPDKMRELIIDGFVTALNAAVPVVIKGAETLAIEGAKAFGKAFISADPLSRVLLTGYLLHKTGGIAAFRAYGKNAGAQVAMGAVTGATTGAAASGWKGAAKSMGKQFGIAAAIAAVVAYGPQFAKDVKQNTSGATPDFNLPKHPSSKVLGIDFDFNKVTALGDLGGQLTLGKERLKSFGDTAEATFKKLKAANDTRALSELSDQARQMARDFPSAATELNHFADVVGNAAGSAVDQFEKMRRAGGRSLREIAQVAADTEFEINQRFGPGTARAKDALSRNFMLAAQAIKRSMDAGKISTKTGMAEIEELFVKALAAYGFTRAEAINRAHGKEFSGKSSPGGTTHTNAARGALIQVGRHGAAGRDNVPAMLNGQRAMVADGEQVAVFNRHQQAELNARLSDTGGLAGFFASNRKPHYMAAGGMISKANKLDSMRLPYKWGGGHGSTTGFDPSGMDCSATVSYILGIPPRVSGDLAGFGRPGPGPVTIYANPQHTFMSLKGRGFGTSGENPGGGPGWLSYSSRGGFTVSHVGLGAADALRRVKMRGGLGAVSTLGQRALDVTRSAAQSQLDGLSAPGMDTGAISGGVNTGDWHGALADIAAERGWSRADWEWIIARESGGSITAKNPSSSAYGLGQLIDSNYRRWGGGPGSTGSEQVRAMASYIAARYGTPTDAKAHWQTYHSYAGGGVIDSNGPAQQSAKGRKKPGKLKPLTINQVKKRLGQRLKQGYPVAGIGRLEDLVGDNGSIERLKKDLDQTRQIHELTDEEKIHTLADGSDVLNTDGFKDDRGHWIGGIKQHVAEDMAELMKAGMIYGGYDQAISGLPHLQKEIDQGIAERNERVKLIARLAVLEVRRRKALEASIRRLQAKKITTAASRRSAINDAADSADADKGSLRDQIANLQQQKHATMSEAERKGLDAQIRGKYDQINTINHRMGRLRRGGDTSALQLHTLALRDDLAGVKGSLEHWVGTSSNDAGQSDAWQPRSIGGDLRNDLTDRWRPARERLASLAFDLPGQRFAAFVDVASIRKDLEDWRDTPAPKPSDIGASGADSQLTDLLKGQLESEKAKSAMLASQFSVFQAFAPLVQGRMLGSFARGLARVPETGLAILHKDETVLPDPAGPFGKRAGTAPAPVQITLMVDGNIGPMVSRMRAEIDGRAARVVSEQLGRSARLMVSARGA